jgi:ubiquinone/menaquinone biosynthesis C-methylase UbiE
MATHETSATIEDVRTYWDRRPCNIRHSTAALGSRQYFDEVEARKYFVEPHIPGFAQFERWAGKQVLEIGCGLGTDTINFARAGAHVTAVDLSDASLALARQRAEVFGLQDHITFYQADAERLDGTVPVRPYDLVYSFGVIHHTPRPDIVVKGIQRYMDNNSEFRLMMYARNSWKDIMIEAGFDQPEAQSGCPVAFTYTHEELRQLLAGYSVTEIRQDHIFPYVIEKYIKYEYERQPWIQAMPADMFRALERRLGWHTLITCQLA